ncbi:MAG: GTPase Era, partial [Chlorobi bacterium]|nr:GTPase Era [Chlorobiota bacterium]
MNENFRAGFVGLFGLPNAGKSTLLNQILGTKISIVTKKPQTTRRRVLGILNGQDHQVVFIDTPGLLDPRYLLQKAMMTEVRSVLNDVDLSLVVLDADRAVSSGSAVPAPLRKALEQISTPVILALNKTDLVRDKGALLPLIETFHKDWSFEEIFPVSALTGDGVPELVQAIVDKLPHHPPYYPTDQLSDQTERFFVAEIIREKVFSYFHQEIPYSTEVVIVEYQEREQGKDFISAEILVERESQRRIIIGEKGKA